MVLRLNSRLARQHGLTRPDDDLLWDRLDGSARAKMFKDNAAQLPAGRIGKAEGYARAILLLATNPYTTGTTLLVDGGTGLV